MEERNAIEAHAAPLCVPALDAFKARLDAEALVVLPKAAIADAIGYPRNQSETSSR